MTACDTIGPSCRLRRRHCGYFDVRKVVVAAAATATAATAATTNAGSDPPPPGSNTAAGTVGWRCFWFVDDFAALKVEPADLLR